MSVWYLLSERSPGAAAENMAWDEYLFKYCHKHKCGFFRIYTWEVPTFSFGVSQKSNRAVNREFVQSNHCAAVRRITGGKTVLHNDELTYAVVSSEDLFFSDHDLYQSYLLISRVLVDALRRIGLEAYLSSGSTPELSRSNHPCFSFPTPNEIEINGKKIIGSAQKRDKEALLQHGSIPFSMDFELYAAGANSQAELIRDSMTTISDLSKITKEQLSASLIAALQDFIDDSIKAFPVEEHREEIELRDLIAKYSSEEWNFSR